MFASWWLLVTPFPALPVEAGALGQLLVPGCTVSPNISHSLLRACGSSCWLGEVSVFCCNQVQPSCLCFLRCEFGNGLHVSAEESEQSCLWRKGCMQGEGGKKGGDNDTRHRHLAHLNTPLRKAKNTSQGHTVLSMFLKEAATSCSPAPSYF